MLPQRSRGNFYNHGDMLLSQSQSGHQLDRAALLREL
jgi:hypothetical protein